MWKNEIFVKINNVESNSFYDYTNIHTRYDIKNYVEILYII